jgi:hypothetical protein
MVRDITLEAEVVVGRLECAPRALGREELVHVDVAGREGPGEVPVAVHIADHDQALRASWWRWIRETPSPGSGLRQKQPTGKAGCGQ